MASSMYWNRKPLFLAIRSSHIPNAMRIILVTWMVHSGESGTISRLTNVRRGLPKNSTHVANSRFPNIAALSSCSLIRLLTNLNSHWHSSLSIWHYNQPSRGSTGASYLAHVRMEWRKAGCTSKYLSSHFVETVTRGIHRALSAKPESRLHPIAYFHEHQTTQHSY